MRTARSRTSGEYLLDVFITPSFQRLESPVKSGRFMVKIACCDAAMDVATDGERSIWFYTATPGCVAVLIKPRQGKWHPRQMGKLYKLN